MKHIIIFGAGKSSIYLIEYIVQQLQPNNWTLTVLDADQQAAQDKIGTSSHARAVALNVDHADERRKHIGSADLVISLLPPALHYRIALDCLEFGKHLLTASYIDPAIEQLRTEIEHKRLLFLCEMGLDPGIDHMSAMRIIDSLHEKNAEIISFRSHCGGLVSPESDNNPWRYKISWNPRNVVLAGKAGAIYLEEGKEKHLPYAKLFEANKNVTVAGLDAFSYYPNRDSLSYIDVYKLHGVTDFIRTTLRYPEFCSGWRRIIQMKLTDENDLYDTDGISLKQFFATHFSRHGSDEDYRSEIQEQLLFLGLEDGETLINKGRCSAADVLQFILEKKLTLQRSDKDMIMMLHEIDYVLKDKKKTVSSSLIVKGEDNVHTAMAKTVGLPLGIAARMILLGKIKLTGLHIPILPEIYQPVLAELDKLGIVFEEF